MLNVPVDVTVGLIVLVLDAPLGFTNTVLGIVVGVFNTVLGIIPGTLDTLLGVVVTVLDTVLGIIVCALGTVLSILVAILGILFGTTSRSPGPVVACKQPAGCKICRSEDVTIKSVTPALVKICWLASFYPFFSFWHAQRKPARCQKKCNPLHNDAS